MWDFNFSQALKLMLKTSPFILLRMAIYFGITLAYLIATGIGAGIGYGVTAFGDKPGSGALWGAFIGFGGISGLLYWAREYILYLVKAAHIAVLVEALDERELPQGKSQVKYGQEVVKERFVEASVLFGIDQLIKGILRVLNGLLLTIARFIPIPGLDKLVSIVNAILKASLTYVDEIILAYNIRIRSTNPWQSSREALVLYAQNYKTMLKNAVFLLLFMYGLTFLIFLIILAPVGAIMSFFPGTVGAWTFLGALLLAWSFKAALLEPLAVTAMTQVFFKVIEGQTPNPEWDAKLAKASGKFRELTDKAKSYAMSKGEPAQASASVAGAEADTGTNPPNSPTP